MPKEAGKERVSRKTRNDNSYPVSPSTHRDKTAVPIAALGFGQHNDWSAHCVEETPIALKALRIEGEGRIDINVGSTLGQYDARSRLLDCNIGQWRHKGNLDLVATRVQTLAPAIATLDSPANRKGVVPATE